MKQKFTIINENVRQRVIDFVKQIPNEAVIEVIFRDADQRSLEQNSKMWPMLSDISKQVVWYGEKLTAEEWKIVFTAGLKKSRVVPGIEGGFVMLGTSTRKMSKKVFSDLIEIMYAFGSERGVHWSEKANKGFSEFGINNS